MCVGSYVIDMHIEDEHGTKPTLMMMIHTQQANKNPVYKNFFMLYIDNSSVGSGLSDRKNRHTQPHTNIRVYTKTKNKKNERCGCLQNTPTAAKSFGCR